MRVRTASVDASVPILLGADMDDVETYVLLRRALSTNLGRDAVRRRRPCGRWPVIERGRLRISHQEGAVHWEDDILRIDAELPETVVAALEGESAGELIDHPACRNRTIAHASMTDGRITILLEPLGIEIASLPGATVRGRARAAAAIAMDVVHEVAPTATLIAIGSGMAIMFLSALAAVAYNGLVRGMVYALSAMIALLVLSIVGIFVSTHEPRERKNGSD